MLRQQILAVIVAVRRSNHRMNMVSGWDAPLIEHQRADWILVIELNHDYRAVDTVIENGVVIGGTDPGEKGVVQMGSDFLHGDCCMGVSEITDVGLNNF